MAETALERQRIIAELTKAPHASVHRAKEEKDPRTVEQRLSDAFMPIGMAAAQQDQEFFAHLLAWNALKGAVRDSKVALPVIQLMTLRNGGPRAIIEHDLALIASLRPREFTKAVKFSLTVPVKRRQIDRLVARYLHDLEKLVKTDDKGNILDAAAYDRTLLQHHTDLHWLYVHTHTKPGRYAKAVLFGPGKADNRADPQWQLPDGSVFRVVKRLRDMEPAEAAGAITKYELPFVMARGAVHEKASHPDIVMALIGRMSANELAIASKWLKRVGVHTVPALRAAYEQALERAGQKPQRNRTLLRATTAAEAVEDEDPTIAAKLRDLQETQIRQAKERSGIKGKWLILGDKSASMVVAIDLARAVAAVLGKMVKDEVHLVFFDAQPHRHIVATGKTYEELKAATALIEAAHGTAIGCGLQFMADKGIAVDGIAIVSDGYENWNAVPKFADAYQHYVRKMGIEPTVYFYQVDTDPRSPAQELSGFLGSCKQAKIDLQTFDLRGKKIDYNSLPNLVQTMRVGRYSLLDEVMNTPLRTLDLVLRRTVGQEVLGGDVARRPAAV